MRRAGPAEKPKSPNSRAPGNLPVKLPGKLHGDLHGDLPVKLPGKLPGKLKAKHRAIAPPRQSLRQSRSQSPRQSPRQSLRPSLHRHRDLGQLARHHLDLRLGVLLVPGSDHDIFARGHHQRLAGRNAADAIARAV